MQLTHSKVLDSLTSVPLSTEENRVGTSGCPQGKLVEGDGLTTGSQDALLRRLSEPESRNRNFGDFGQTDVIGNSSDLNNDFRRQVGGAGGLFHDAGEGDGGTVDLGKEKSVEDDLFNPSAGSCLVKLPWKPHLSYLVKV